MVVIIVYLGVSLPHYVGPIEYSIPGLYFKLSEPSMECYVFPSLTSLNLIPFGRVGKMPSLGYYIGWIENKCLDMVSPLSTSHIVEYKFQPLISLC